MPLENRACILLLDKIRSLDIVMNMRYARMLILFLFFLPSLFAKSSEEVQASYATLQLHSENEQISPGKTFWLGIAIKLEPGWHIYWKNPGGPGLPPEISWETIEGVDFGEITYPAPKRFDFDGIINYGSEGNTFLLIPVTLDKKITAPQLTFNATVNLLICKDVCVPAKTTLQLTIPVASPAKTDTQEESFFSEARNRLPKTDPKLTADFSFGNDTLTAKFTLSDPVQIHSAYFYSDKEIIAADKPQTFNQENHSVTLLLPLNKTSTLPEMISGILEISTDQGNTHISIPGHAIHATVTPNTTAAFAFNAGFLTTLGFGFLGGLILNLMPCVFPVIGLKIVGFVNQSGNEKSKIIAHGITFTAGVLLSFWIMAILLIALRQGGTQLGWGFQLQEPRFIYLLIIVILAFAMNLSGVFEIGTSAMNVGSSLTRKSGLSGSFFSGFLATVIATPCSAPFLAPALGKILTLPAFPSLVLFTMIGLGLAFPYLLLSLFPSLLNCLPKPGAWMESFKQGMAFLLYATVAFLVWTFIGQIPDESILLYLLLGLIVIAFSLWIYGRWANIGRTRKTRVLATGLSLMLILLTVTGSLLSISRSREQANTQSNETLVWEPWSHERVEQALASGKKVYVDFTARWCATCQWNKRNYNDTDVQKAFREQNVVLLKADWTNKDPAITQELARFNRFAVPFNVLFIPNKEPVILPELISPTDILDALKK